MTRTYTTTNEGDVLRTHSGLRVRILVRDTPARCYAQIKAGRAVLFQTRDYPEGFTVNAIEAAEAQIGSL